MRLKASVAPQLRLSLVGVVGDVSGFGQGLLAGGVLGRGVLGLVIAAQL